MANFLSSVWEDAQKDAANFRKTLSDGLDTAKDGAKHFIGEQVAGQADPICDDIHNMFESMKGEGVAVFGNNFFGRFIDNVFNAVANMGEKLIDGVKNKIDHFMDKGTPAAAPAPAF